MSWAVPVQNFPWAIVEHRLHPFDLAPRHALELGASGDTFDRQLTLNSGRLRAVIGTNTWTGNVSMTGAVANDHVRALTDVNRREFWLLAALAGELQFDEYVELMHNLKLANPKMMDVAVPANMKCGRPEGAIVEVLERRTKQVAGRFVLEGGVGFVTSDNRRISQRDRLDVDKQRRVGR